MGVRFVRFVQWGVWSPIFRPHDGGNTDTRVWERAEPYAAALRDATRLRGALTPAVYTLAARSAFHAWPYVEEYIYHILYTIYCTLYTIY